MILRKPYAFLIKNFKIINLIIAVLFIYIAFRTYQLYAFVKYYIAEGWTGNLNFTASTYVDVFIYLAIVGVIVFTTIIILLMKKKEKPTKLYVIDIVFYIVLFILFIFSYTTIHALETGTLDTRVVDLLRDMNLIAFLGQIVLIIFELIRGLGFNIKKFNFGEDIAELQIEMADNEEVEVNFGVDTENFMTTLRRKRREFNYVYQENKFVIRVFVIVFLLIIGLVIYMNVFVYNKIYQENETFRAGNFNVTITDAYVTKTNYKDKTIADTGQSYLVIKLKATNITSINQALSYENYVLISGAATYAPTTDEYDDLFDIGTGYDSQEVAKYKTNEYTLVYLIDDRSLSNKLYIRYTNKITYSVGKFVADYIKTAITTENLDKAATSVRAVALTKKLSFEGSLLGDSSITIKSYDIQDSFIYDYSNAIQYIIKPKSDSNYSKAIMALDTSLVLDKNINMDVDAFDIISKLGTINYTLNGEKKKQTVELINETPINYKGTLVYFEVLSEVKDATNISIVFDIRDKQYTYTLK